MKTREVIKPCGVISPTWPPLIPSVTQEFTVGRHAARNKRTPHVPVRHQTQPRWIPLAARSDAGDSSGARGCRFLSFDFRFGKHSCRRARLKSRVTCPIQSCLWRKTSGWETRRDVWRMFTSLIRRRLTNEPSWQLSFLDVLMHSYNMSIIHCVYYRQAAKTHPKKKCIPYHQAFSLWSWMIFL